LKVTGDGALTGEDVTFIFAGSSNDYAHYEMTTIISLITADDFGDFEIESSASTPIAP
jgi:hypothetical protein